MEQLVEALHCNTNRKVTGSIPDGVNGTFNLSGRTLALQSDRSLTQMSARRVS